MSWRVVVVALAVLAAPSSAQAATTYYVAPDGNDRAAGTSPEAAWRTPGRIGSVDLDPGDRVLFAGGAVFEGAVVLGPDDEGTAQAPVVVGSYGAGRATLAPTRGTAVYAQDAGGLVFEDLVLRGPGMDVASVDGLAIYASRPPGRRLPPVRVRRVDVAGFGAWGVAIGSWAGTAGYDGIEVTGVEAHGNGLGGIFTYAEQPAAHRGVTVRDSVAYGNPGRAGLVHSSGNGIVVAGADGALIEGNVAHDNGGRGTSGEGPVGIWAYDSRRVVIQGNESYDNRTGGPVDGGGFDLDVGVTDSVMQFNRSHDNDGAGFMLANPAPDRAHAGNVVRFNLSERDGRRNGYAGLYVWGRADGLALHHNTVVGPALVLHATALGGGSADVRDNVFVRTAPGPVVDVAADATAMVFAGNAYRGYGGRPVIGWAGAAYEGLGPWRAATGQEPAGVEADPLLGAGYVPAPGSPLIDAALELPASTLPPAEHDLAGTPLGARPDIGAFEAPPASRPPEPTTEPTTEPLPAPAATPSPAPLPSGSAAPASAGPRTPPQLVGATAPPPARAKPARGRASPRLRIDRVAWRGRRVRVSGHAARGVRLVRVTARRGSRRASRRVAVRGGRYTAAFALPRRRVGAELLVRVSYAGDRVHHAQQRIARVR